MSSRLIRFAPAVAAASQSHGEPFANAVVGTEFVARNGLTELPYLKWVAAKIESARLAA